MKKYSTITGLIFLTFISLLSSNFIFAQSGPFTVNVKVVTKDYKPLENAKVVLASNNHFSDIDIKTTDASGKVQLTAKYGGDYELDIHREAYVSSYTNFNINKYGDEKEFSLVFDLEKKSDEGKKVTSSTYFTIKGKDKNGNISPVSGANIHTIFGTFATNGSGFLSISHTLGKGDEFPYYVEADGFQPKNGALIIDETKIIYWSNNEPDKIEIILDPINEEDYGKLKSGKFALNVLVLNSENESPIPDAVVDLKMRKPYDGKTTFSSLRADPKGIARFEGVNTDLIQNELYVAGTHDNFEEKWSDVTSSFFSDLSAKEFTFTLYLNPKSQSTKQYILESIECKKLSFQQDDFIDTKTWRREYKFSLPQENTTVEFTNLSDAFPKGIDPNDNITLKAAKKVIGPMKMEKVIAQAVWRGELHYQSDFFDINESGTTIQVPPVIYDKTIQLVMYIKDSIYDFYNWIVVTYRISK